MFRHNRLVLFGVFTAAGMLGLPSCQFLPSSLSGGRGTPTISSPRGGSSGGSSDASSSSGSPSAANSGKKSGSRGREVPKEKYTFEQKNAAREKYQKMVAPYLVPVNIINRLSIWDDKPGTGCGQQAADMIKKLEEANYLEDFTKACVEEFEPMLSEYDTKECRYIKTGVKEIIKKQANACITRAMEWPVKVIEDHISKFKGGGQGSIGWEAIDIYYDTTALFEKARESIAPILPWADGGEIDPTPLKEAQAKLKQEITDWKAEGFGLHTQWATWWGKGAKAPGALALAKKYAKSLKISGKKVKLKKIQLDEDWEIWRSGGVPTSQSLKVFLLVELKDFPRPLVVAVAAYKEYLGGGRWGKVKLQESPEYILGEK